MSYLKEKDIPIPRNWNRTAIECYESGCNCSKCNLRNIITSDTCQMKHTVFELVRLYGKPRYNKPAITNFHTKIIKLFINHYGITEIAKILNSEKSTIKRHISRIKAENKESLINFGYEFSNRSNENKQIFIDWCNEKIRNEDL